ncbi:MULTISPECIES: glutathione S-transferase family protein [Marinobacter]|uniref:Glutathione S-transferase N-terminal domain-containing protein n=1 Tax=Marinobacter suaedae TaxID=3057675 RepID=A0ABT8VYR6_9GAMM|nr:MULTISPECIES: glutathione S-transferase N-terminal domain-containing protein [unclassified Marinobacter]MBZ2169271.1 glutathione S-transferase N-terminal domain-containing protein [Marinobacter sp. F4216]MDO3721141.1 glutathione S-transferase N-terminal domain-containing protein [Marinobacter sp. chi1]
MKLIGSTTSPYVRRIRILLGEEPHEFVNLDIYGEGRDELRKTNPTLKIPVLEDEGQEIYDSRIIARYISAKQGRDPLTWDQQNQLTLIDGANDSAVIMLLSERSGIDTGQDLMFYNLQRERILTTLRTLAAMVDDGHFDDWDYPSMCLYCLVDWLDFRSLVEWTGIESLLSFRDRHQDEPWVARTDPRG